MDLVNFAASEVILRNRKPPVHRRKAARLSIAASLVRGPIGLLVPILAERAQGSTGRTEEGVAVPNVVGSTLDAATAVLQTGRLVVESRRAYSADVRKDTVISQEPQAHVPRPFGSTVRLLVSDGGVPPAPAPDVGPSDTATAEQLETAKQEIESQFAAAKQEIETQFTAAEQEIETQFTAVKQEIEAQITTHLRATRRDIEQDIVRHVKGATDSLAAQIAELKGLVETAAKKPAKN